jgi:hypothetical protein
MQFNAMQLRKAKLPDAQDAQCRSNAGKEWLAQADDSGVQMPQESNVLYRVLILLKCLGISHFC